MNTRYLGKLGLAVGLLVTSVYTSAETELTYRLTYSWSENLVWSLLGDAPFYGGISHTFKNDLSELLKYGELRYTQVNAHSSPGKRSFTVEVPINAGAKRIYQYFTLSEPYIGVSTLESGPTFPPYICTGDSCPPSIPSSDSSETYNPGLPWSRSISNYPKFDVNNPSAYMLPSPLSNPVVSINLRTDVDSGLIIKQYEANVSFNVSIIHDFIPWQVNQLLARAVNKFTTPKKDTSYAHSYPGVVAIVTPNFGFMPKEAANAGRYPSTTPDGRIISDEKITYDHFNWIQKLTGVSVLGVPIHPLLYPLLVPGLVERIDQVTGIDPIMNGQIAGCDTDSYSYYYDEREINNIPGNTVPFPNGKTYPCSNSSVYALKPGIEINQFTFEDYPTGWGPGA